MRVIVYHDNCHDGVTALWVALQVWPDAVAYPGRYSEPPDLERLAGHDVVCLDFSWKREAMMQVHAVAKSLLVLDHHKSAEAELQGLDWAVFDQERSGAGLAWDLLHGGPRPRLVDYVEDRDLWRFALLWCREVHAACNSYPLTIEARAMLMTRSIADLVDEGVAILRYHDQLVTTAAEKARRERIGGVEVPSIACPLPEIISDLGHRLAEDAPFAAVWCEQPDGSTIYSLRSRPEGADVSEVARAYGGGGHRNAAGFTLAAGVRP